MAEQIGRSCSGRRDAAAIAQFLADSADSAPVSMIAEQGISAGGKISMQEAPEGYTYMRLELPFDRAWASWVVHWKSPPLK